MEYKRNQIEEAIFRIFGAREERRNELKFRIKRLLVTDRRLGRNVKSCLYRKLDSAIMVMKSAEDGRRYNVAPRTGWRDGSGRPC